MARQEVIDGPGVAAKILSRFPAEEREHLVAALWAQAPQVAARLQRRIVEFTRVDQPPAPNLQSLLREIAPSLTTTEEPVQQRILENVSETKLEMVKEDISLLPAMEVSDVEAAQARILRRLEELYPEEPGVNQPKRFRSRLA